MCGIAGIHGAGDKQLVKKMTSALEHRGPDDEGYYVDDKISLGNRRLSIIDLEGGHQPVHNEDESIWITYNGEIYNYKELREELRGEGHRFYTDSDTEVIVHAYEEWGEDCVRRFDGMFAFAIWDSDEEKLFLARDHIGIKPLYFTRTKGRFLFSSEIKSFLEHPSFEAEVNLEAMNDFLSLKHTLPGETMFKGVGKLKPGHYLVMKGGNIAKKQYWDLNFNPEDKPEEFWIEKIKKTLRSSVEKRLIADVPLGVFLSGGIDSSSMVALMNEVHDKPIETFTVGFGNSEIGELEEARRTSEYYGTKHHEIRLRENDYDLLPEIIWHHDEPTGDVTCLALYKLSQMTSKHVKTVLNGTGGDEQFAGYDTYKLALWNKRVNWMPSFMRKFAKGITKPFLSERRGRGLDHLFGNNNYQETYFDVNTLLDEDEKKMIYSEGLNSFKPSVERGKDIMNRSKSSPLNNMLYYQNKAPLPQDLLFIADRNSMAHSLEARVPFLSRNMIELACKIPPSLKLKGFTEKYILKKTMRKILPKEITQRRKRPFRMPVETFFQDNLTYLADEYLINNKSARKFFKKRQVEKILGKHKRGKRRYSYKLFNLLSFQIWHEKFINP